MSTSVIHPSPPCMITRPFCLIAVCFRLLIIHLLSLSDFYSRYGSVSQLPRAYSFNLGGSFPLMLSAGAFVCSEGTSWLPSGLRGKPFLFLIVVKSHVLLSCMLQVLLVSPEEARHIHNSEGSCPGNGGSVSLPVVDARRMEEIVRVGARASLATPLW